MKGIRFGSGAARAAIAGAAIAGSMAIPHAASAQGLPWLDSNSDIRVETLSGSWIGCPNALGWREDSDNSMDGGGTVTVAGTAVGAGASAFALGSAGSDALATYPESGTESIGDFGVSVSYRITSSNIVRTIVSITNNGIADATDVVVGISNMFPDDTASTYSSDNWFVTFADGYGPVLHAPQGSGTVESPASFTTCRGAAVDIATSEFPTIVFGYSVDIPVGATRRLLVFQGMAPGGTPQQGQDLANSFGPNSQVPGSGILSDLTLEQACTVVNWVLEGCGESTGGDGTRIILHPDHFLWGSDEPSSQLPDTL